MVPLPVPLTMNVEQKQGMEMGTGNLEVEMETNWEYDQEAFRKGIRVERREEEDHEEDDDDVFDPDSVHLDRVWRLVRPKRRREKDEEGQGKCVMKIRAKERGWTLDRMVIVSEAKLLELSRLPSGEYLSTFSGDLAEDSDQEIKMYVCDIRMEEFGRMEQCKIKIVSKGKGEEHSGGRKK